MKPTSLFLITAALFAAWPAHAESVAPLTWTSCGIPGTSPADVAARTECARLTVPRDYTNPAAGLLDLDVVRVNAAGEHGSRHDGTLLLEPDEFADGIDRSVPAMAAAWLDGDEDWRNVARRLDIVGLAQRRMDNVDGRDCLSATSRVPRHASLGGDTSFSNVMIAEHLALAVATACQNDPMHAHIGMRPRVEDMERLREALGQSKLHLLGVGRGGWVAARYAERFPGNVGRMLLDGTWDADGSIAEAMEARVHERGRTNRRLLALGLPPERDANEDGDPYGFGPRSVGAAPALLASAFAARCNDGSWGTDSLYWRARTRELRDMWPSAVRNETFQGMVCSEWPGAFGSTSVPVLDGVPPFLMLHAEFDDEAPLRNAAMMLNAHGNASMVVARELRAHGVVMRNDRPCVAAAASRFLADGILPAAKLTNCRVAAPLQAR